METREYLLNVSPGVYIRLLARDLVGLELPPGTKGIYMAPHHAREIAANLLVMADAIDRQNAEHEARLRAIEETRRG